ncbi:hypothetical protein KY337_01700, partial [Candidatus Woesearchaeota archaeon]|nr:hypothetical protein [Candidatus Woesearchaeota archaeon]
LIGLFAHGAEPPKQEPVLERKVQRPAYTFMVGPHKDEADAANMLAHVSRDKYKYLLIESPFSKDMTSQINYHLSNLFVEYQSTHSERIYGRRDIDFLQRLEGAFANAGSFGKSAAHLILGSTKKGVVPHFFEAYSDSQLHEVDRLQSKMVSELQSVRSDQDLEDFVDAAVECASYRNSHMISRLKEMRSKYKNSLVFVGAAHMDIARHFPGASLIELPMDGHPLPSILQKKIGTPGYKLTAVDRSRLFKYLQSH